MDPARNAKLPPSHVAFRICLATLVAAIGAGGAALAFHADSYQRIVAAGGDVWDALKEWALPW